MNEAHATYVAAALEEGGRSLGAQKFFAGLSELVIKRRLPRVGWLVRERFRTLVRRLRFRDALPQQVLDGTVSGVLAWARTTQSRLEATGTGDEAFDLNELITLSQQLDGAGLIDATSDDLGLPGPDLSGGGYFGDLYSRERKTTRVTTFFAAVAETYRAVCEHYLEVLGNSFFFAMFPARAIISLDSGKGFGAGWRAHWEPTEGWNERPIVTNEQTIHEWSGIRRLADHVRLKCSRMNRPFHFSMKATVGSWDPWDEAVTDEVIAFLEADLKRVRAWLEVDTSSDDVA